MTSSASGSSVCTSTTTSRIASRGVTNSRRSRDVISELDAIDYSHYFTNESHQSVNPLPNEIAEDGIRMMHKIGEAILAMEV